MPGPDPQGLDIDERSDGSFTITAEVWRYGNRKHRLARMFAVSRRIKTEGWRCPWCGEPCRSTAGPTRDTAARAAVVVRRVLERRCRHHRPISTSSTISTPPAPMTTFRPVRAGARVVTAGKSGFPSAIVRGHPAFKLGTMVGTFAPTPDYLVKFTARDDNGGEEGIRTLETVPRLHP